MRLFLITLPCIALSACMNTSPQTAAAPVAAAPFTVPMDPGLIPCSALSNPNALAAASEWTLGQARAGIMAGTRSDLPTVDAISAGLSQYCRANGNDVARNAARAIGV